MNPHSFDRTDTKPRRKGFGCLAKTLIGLVAIPSAIVGGAWLLVMHSSLPLRFVATIIEEGGADANLKLTGTSGSLSSGLSFKKIEWDEGEITDLRFRYSGLMDVIRRKELIIYEMHIGSATIDTSSFSDDSEESDSESTKDSEPKPKSESPDDPTPEIESTDTPSPATEADDKPEGTVFLALHRDSNTEIRYEIPVTESINKQQSFTPVLTSTPAMSPEDLLALLFHDREYTNLAPADQEKLRQHMTWFTYP